MAEEAGWINSIPLMKECEHKVFWAPNTPRGHVEAVITVLRRRGLLNDAGVEIVRAEMGDRK